MSKVGIYMLLLLAFPLMSSKCEKKAEEMAEEGVEIEEAEAEVPKLLVNMDYQQPKDMPAVTIKSAAVKGDYLTVNVEYSGGCELHNFDLITRGMYMKSLPPQLPIMLNHENNGDACRELKSEKLVFDITEARYGNDESGEVHLRLDGWEEKLIYKY